MVLDLHDFTTNGKSVWLEAKKHYYTLLDFAVIRTQKLTVSVRIPSRVHWFWEFSEPKSHFVILPIIF